MYKDIEANIIDYRRQRREEEGIEMVNIQVEAHVLRVLLNRIEDLDYDWRKKSRKHTDWASNIRDDIENSYSDLLREIYHISSGLFRGGEILSVKSHNHHFHGTHFIQPSFKLKTKHTYCTICIEEYLQTTDLKSFKKMMMEPLKSKTETWAKHIEDP